MNRLLSIISGNFPKLDFRLSADLIGYLFNEKCRERGSEATTLVMRRQIPALTTRKVLLSSFEALGDTVKIAVKALNK